MYTLPGRCRPRGHASSKACSRVQQANMTGQISLVRPFTVPVRRIASASTTSRSSEAVRRTGQPRQAALRTRFAAGRIEPGIIVLGRSASSAPGSHPGSRKTRRAMRTRHDRRRFPVHLNRERRPRPRAGRALKASGARAWPTLIIVAVGQARTFPRRRAQWTDSPGRLSLSEESISRV